MGFRDHQGWPLWGAPSCSCTMMLGLDSQQRVDTASSVKTSGYHHRVSLRVRLSEWPHRCPWLWPRLLPSLPLPPELCIAVHCMFLFPQAVK